jgi:pyroglutamyl-peptidase
VHIPLVARDASSQRKSAAHRITPEQLVDAGEAVVLEMVELTRQAMREGPVSA